MAKYYKVNEKEWLPYEKIKDSVCTEAERGLNAKTCYHNNEHRWLLLPRWNRAVIEGQKQYIICLKCGEQGHL